MPRKDVENHCEAAEPREAVMYGSDLPTICSKSPTEGQFTSPKCVFICLIVMESQAHDS